MKPAKSIDRTARRQFERENAKILAEFSTVVNNFEDALFSFDWDASEQLSDFPIFEKFNQIWIDFCERWNKDKSHVALALPSTFYDYAIDNTLKIDTNNDNIGSATPIKNVSNEKENNGDNGRPEGQEGQVRKEGEKRSFEERIAIAGHGKP